jgi:hypothetical protein
MRFYLKIEKYIWLPAVDITERNFFSAADAVLWGTTYIADDDILEISDIKYTHDTSDNGEIFIQASNFSFKISDLEKLKVKRANSSIEYYWPRQFFDVDIPFDNEKWRVYLYKGDRTSRGEADELLLQGIISIGAVSEQFANDDSSDVLDFTVVGFEKEFKDYFQSVPLPYPLTGWQNFTPLQVQMQHMSIESMLGKICGISDAGFGTVIAPEIAEWFITRVPNFEWVAVAGGLPYLFLKNGYDVVAYNGENVYDFVRRLCNSCGWKFYFLADKFIIRNKVSSNQNLVTLDYNDIDNFTVSRDDVLNEYKIIYISDGLIEGDISCFPFNEWGQGARLVFCKSLLRHTNSQNHWSDINFGGKILGLNPNHLPSYEYCYMRYANETGLRYDVVKTGIPGKGLGYYYNTVPKKQVLKIDGGEAGKNGWCTKLVFPQQNKLFEFGVSPIGNLDLIYAGNYGSMLFKKKTINGAVRISDTYQTYIMSDDLKRNYAKYTGFRNTFDCDIQELYTNPEASIRFDPLTLPQDQNPFPLASKTFDIIEHSFNLVEETTNFKFQPL